MEKMKLRSRGLGFTIYCFIICAIFIITACGGGSGGGSSDSSRSWSVSLNGNNLEISYGRNDNFPQYCVLDLNSSYFRMVYSPDAVWGTSIILSPSFWESGTYFQGTQIFTTWETNGADLVVSISGAISGLSFEGEVCISPPEKNAIIATITMNLSGSIDLDDRPGEAFKPIMLSSMRISEDIWDSQTAFVDSQSFSIPQNGWIINPPVIGSEFGLIGGTSDWKKNGPTVEVQLDQNLPITGWVTPSNDPNDDNVGFWAASDEVISSWDYEIQALP